jgi:hypothetical protein
MRLHACTLKVGLRRCAALTAIGAVAAASLTLVTPAASAVAPDNDSWKSATPVTALPFEDSVDTTDATTDAVNPPDFGGRFTHHSIWYHLNLPNDGKVLLSTMGTDYTHKLVLYQADSATARPAGWVKVAGDRAYRRSGAGMVQSLEAGTDYFVGIGAYRTEPGGTAMLLVRAPAEVDITLDEFADFDPVDGSAKLHGLMSSDLPSDVYMQIRLRQLVGDRVVRATGRKRLLPPTDHAAWRMRISGDYGFKLGDARVGSEVRVYDLGVRVATFRLAEKTVTLQ